MPAAAKHGKIAVMEAVLFLSSEMRCGLGLLVPIHTEVIPLKELLKRVTRDHCQWLPLWTGAAKHGRTDTLQWLYEHNFSNSVETSAEFTCGKFWRDIADSAAEGGSVEALKWCVRFRDAWAARVPKETIAEMMIVNYLERCPFIAAERGHLDALKYLVSFRALQRNTYGEKWVD